VAAYAGLTCFLISALVGSALLAGAQLRTPISFAIALVVPLCAALFLTVMGLVTNSFGEPPRLSWPTTILALILHGALTATVSNLILQVGTTSSASSPPRGLLPAAIWIQGPLLIVITALLQIAALSALSKLVKAPTVT